MSILRKVMKSIRDLGIRRTCHGAIHILIIEFNALCERRFDRTYHIDPSRIVRIEKYGDISDEQKGSAIRYQATPIKRLRAILSAV